MTKWLLFTAGALAGSVLLLAQRSSYGPNRIWWDADQGGFLPRSEDYENPDGLSGMVNKSGSVRVDGHAFFTALGGNGRACITCHQPSNAMSVSTATIRQRWADTNGKDPLFAAIDGSNCPGLPQSAAASHSLIFNRGVFRIALPWPPKDVKPDFTVEVVHDPTGCNTDPRYGVRASENLSVFRRPRVVGNLESMTEAENGTPTGMSLMADGREVSLRTQAITAALTHEQADAVPQAAQLAQILQFERQIFVAQSADARGGLLNESNGPDFLGPDSLAEGKAGSPAGVKSAISAAVWNRSEGIPLADMQKAFRESAARGSELFLHRAFATGALTRNTCASCHNQKASAVAMEIGTNNHSRRDAAPDLPLFKVTCSTGNVIYTQDPGRALITGKCADTGAIVPQQLRGLAARAPYFANGSARTLRGVVDFYDRQYSIGCSERDKQDLVNFLKTL